eukprot:CAMPEP_0206061214 /NCGR_PEP_ID=MMETSP1466-20131121/53533_1 /ASSEMBLY_ACC=CAM_ASM_001126 /TAXON_ID=44452 /ORGANISM="Pavlova gyrans, Strain CCMP608" /LENGTH=100 /DNA_ID=CAMNT_0053436561 /DNA_START=29 /DNA_END=328 /DNA_ORIENTATION=-
MIAMSASMACMSSTRSSEAPLWRTRRMSPRMIFCSRPRLGAENAAIFSRARAAAASSTGGRDPGAPLLERPYSRARGVPDFTLAELSEASDGVGAWGTSV